MESNIKSLQDMINETMTNRFLTKEDKEVFCNMYRSKQRDIEKNIKVAEQKIKNSENNLCSTYLSKQGTINYICVQKNLHGNYKKIKEPSEKNILWNKSVEHDKITEKYLKKKTIYSEKQNYPELVVEEIMEEFNLNKYGPSYRNRLYSILLKTGVNKWFFVRKLLIRLKIVYREKINDIHAELMQMKKQKVWKKSDTKKYHTLKGELRAYTEIRKELMLLCNTPRWVVWNWKKVGLIDFAGLNNGIKKKWIKLHKKLTDIRFKK